MNRVLKYAWYQLIIVLSGIVFAGILIGIMATYWRGKEVSAVIIFGPLVLVHLFKIFFPLKPGEIAFDERDLAIKTRATQHSFIVFWYVFIISCMAPILIIGNGSIHVMYLGGLLVAAGLLFRITWSISVIIQYGRTGSNENMSEVQEGGAV